MTWKKELNNVFLEKSELQLPRTSILFPLFGVSSMWNFQNAMFRQNIFLKKFCFFRSRRELNSEKIDPEMEKKFNYLP